MEEGIHSVLSMRYGLHAESVKEVAGGWSARAFIVYGGGWGCFVKLYDKRRVSTRPWIDRIDAYMPTVLWLSANTRLRQRMTAPLLTQEGAYKVEDGAYVWMVYPLIEGEAIGGARLDPRNARELALILAELHAYGEGIPVKPGVPRETYALPFVAGLDALLKEPEGEALKTALAPYAKRLQQGFQTLCGLADSLRSREIRFALCHTDVHGWNLMRAEGLVLIDWEGLMLAPPEADLFVFSDGFFFDHARDAFISAYREACGGYIENEEAMAFYRLRRRIEDIAAFADSIAHDGLSPEETQRSLRHLSSECEALSSGWGTK